MPFEMSCANCEGRLMVETLGIVVACPHCGTHLSIPAEIPGLTNPPPEPESAPGESVSADAGDGQEYPWESAMEENELPDSFPDFSQGTGSGMDRAASESNVIVSEPEIQAETEVPSAIRVANPDPSAVIPAIVTDATMSEPISGFPVLDEPKPKTIPQQTPPEPETAVEEQPLEESPAPEPPATEDASQSEAAPIVVDSPEPTGEFPGISGGTDEQTSEHLPSIDTDAAEMTESFPAMNDNNSSANPPGVAEAREESVGEFPVMGAAETSFAPVVATDTPKAEPLPAQASAKPAASPAEKTEEKKETVYDSVYNSRRGKIVPHAVFQAWFSYTILVTFGLAWAIYRIFTAQASNLESLPDIKPLKENTRNYVPQKAAMPPGHTLELSQTQRFGHIEVTPLKVTKDKLEIEGWDPEGPVLKLYLKFKNVSDDQTIVPLDGELLFDQNTQAEGPPANQFICKASEKHKKDKVVLVYARLADLDFEFRNQNLGKALKPGEEVTIYIPSETEGLEYLTGDLIWRVHFRKGHSPKNYGVTTVLEVKFHSEDIQSGSTAV